MKTGGQLTPLSSPGLRQASSRLESTSDCVHDRYRGCDASANICHLDTCRFRGCDAQPSSVGSAYDPLAAPWSEGEGHSRRQGRGLARQDSLPLSPRMCLGGLDAPCTGSGTFLTNPELKWRQNQKFLNQNIVLQRKLFETALKLLKYEGIIVYSTCSLYPEEGEHIIMNFLKDLDPQMLPDWISPSYSINGSKLPGTGRLFPAIHHTKGFFIGKFKKKER